METQLTYVAVAHNEVHYNRPFIDSMLNQSDPNWKAIIYHNGPNPDMRKYVEWYDDPRLVYMESSVDTGSWGTANRQHGIGICDTEFICNTSIQDYYTPNTVESVQNAIKSGSDFVHWQSVSHLFRYNTLSGEVAFGHIDWGQWCVKTEYLKQTGVQKPSEFCSDWFTVEQVYKQYVKQPYKINQVLHIHN